MRSPETKDRRKHGLSLPDFRGWAAIGFFAITFQSLVMIDHNPALLGVPSFMQFISMLSTGGVLLVASHLFGGTRSGAETSARLADTVTNLTSKAATSEPEPVAK